MNCDVCKHAIECDVCKHDIECYEGDCFNNGKAYADDYFFVVCADCLNNGKVTLEEDDLLKFVVNERKNNEI